MTGSPPGSRLAGPPATTRVARFPRALRHLLATTLLVLIACAAVTVLSILSYRDSSAALDRLRANAVGTVVATAPGSVTVTWGTRTATARAATARTATVGVSADIPAGTRTEVRYDPADPSDAIVPGATLLTAAGRAEAGIVVPPLVAAGVLLADAAQFAALALAARRPSRPVRLRRVRLRRGLLSRSWLETEPGPGAGPPRWIPVHWDPALTELPAPAEVRLRGRRRLVLDLPDGRRLYSSGRATTTEPRGRRTDSPSHPDPLAVAAAHRHGPLRRLRVDAAFLVPVPLIALLWTYLSGTAFPGWLAATAITAATALWYPAHRGADPT